jgi:hypothetical protein
MVISRRIPPPRRSYGWQVPWCEFYGLLHYQQALEPYRPSRDFPPTGTGGGRRPKPVDLPTFDLTKFESWSLTAPLVPQPEPEEPDVRYTIAMVSPRSDPSLGRVTRGNDSPLRLLLACIGGGHRLRRRRTEPGCGWQGLLGPTYEDPSDRPLTKGWVSMLLCRLP